MVSRFAEMNLLPVESSEAFYSLLMFGAVFFFVGKKLIAQYPRLKLFGLGLSAFVFVVASVVVFFGPLAKLSTIAAVPVHGLIFAFLFLGPCWVLLSGFGALASFWSTTSSEARRASARRKSEREAKEAEQKRRRERQEWDRQAPERERRQLEDAKRREEETRQRLNEQKMRTDARADCEMLYQLYAVDIAGRFPRASLDEWINKYMNDNVPAREVEDRAEQLRKVILHHREQVKPTPKFMSLVQLFSWYQKQVDEIEAVPMDDRFKRTLIASLNVRRAEYIQSMMNDN